MPERQLYAGIDLGSNSFHMVVARLEHGQLRVIDRIKDMVRLAGGLDSSGRLDPETHQRALAALARFGERVRGVPDHQIRAVGTQTFRRLSHPAAFLVVAETALGCPIDIVSGREEARLVWLGVSQGVAPTEGRRLVIDIGGGSTELVAGEQPEPALAESLAVGCVGLTRKLFSDGELSEARYHRALNLCRAELQPWASQFRRYGWNQVIGSSGTIRALASMVDAREASVGHITPATLGRLRERLLQFGRIDRITLEGLSDRRRPVIIGGLAILESVMELLAIDSITVSPFALREGLLQDLLGRLAQRDPRNATVSAMRARYEIDADQAARVSDWTLSAFEQVQSGWALKPIHGDILHWISQLHEIGLAIAHDGYQRHTAYILEHADMPGFSRQEQQFMAIVTEQQRRQVKPDRLRTLPDRLQHPARCLIALLRLAVTLYRPRSGDSVGDYALQAGSGFLELALEPGWLAARPLLRHDLEIDSQELAALGLELKLAELSESRSAAGLA